MSWKDQDNNEIGDLLCAGFEEIRSFTVLCYHFKFGKMTPFDRTSILMNTQNCCQDGFSPEEFTEYLLQRKIPYKLYFIPAFRQSLIINMEHLSRVIKLNFKKLLTN